jgi:hypothetical protein
VLASALVASQTVTRLIPHPTLARLIEEGLIILGWVYAALTLIVLMTIQGFGYLLPTNLRVCFELQKSHPDVARISRLMNGYFYVVASQGIMQVAIIVIMARFVTGI